MHWVPAFAFSNILNNIGMFLELRLKLRGIHPETEKNIHNIMNTTH